MSTDKKVEQDQEKSTEFKSCAENCYTAKQAREDRNNFYLYKNHKNICDEVLAEIKKIASGGGQGYILSDKYTFGECIVIGNVLQDFGYKVMSYDAIIWLMW